MNGSQWKEAADLSRERRDRPNAYIELTTPTRARFVRYEHVHVGAANLAVSDIRVFGKGAGARPATPQALTARRDRDERNATIAWKSVGGVVGSTAMVHLALQLTRPFGLADRGHTRASRAHVVQTSGTIESR